MKHHFAAMVFVDEKQWPFQGNNHRGVRGAGKGEEKLGKGGLPAGETGEKKATPLDSGESE